MCGISGIVYRDPAYMPDQARILAMRDTLEHRGPDDAGDYVAPGIGLGARRLAILDLSERGHMPMSTPDGRYWIVYNGEVYNYRELRAKLQAKGYRFKSNTDTEVVLALYGAEGPEMVSQLNGMFAIAVWDTRERTLFIARDHLGIKPLYYAERDGAFYFASEEKALFAAGVKPEFDTDVWEELLYFRYVAGERTPFVGVKRLLPGHSLLWKDGCIRIRRWWNLAERALEQRENLTRDPLSWYQETFDDAINIRRICDVPVGVLLSGGLDSSSIAASLAEQSESQTASFTVRFSEPKYDEGPLAQQVAERWKLDYHELIVAPDKLLSMLHTASWLNDEPLVHGNDLHLLAISQYAKPRVTVLLSGEGADETLGGYVRYRPLAYPALLNAAKYVVPRASAAMKINGRFRKLGRFLALGSISKFVLFNACEVLPGEVEFLRGKPSATFAFREQVLAEAAMLHPDDPVRQAMYSDQHTFLNSILDRNDRMTMGASIECRVPFLDRRLVEMLAALPSSAVLSGKESKHLLRQSAGKRLPEAVLRHRKWGFGVPWSKYMRNIPELREIVTGLPKMSPVREAPFDLAILQNTINSFLAGNNTHEVMIRQLVMIVIWYQAVFSTQVYELAQLAALVS